MDISLLNDKEARIRLEDVVKALDEIGVPGAPEFDTPAQRIRALAEMLAQRIHGSQVALNAAVELQQKLSGHQILANAAWQPFPEVPPTRRPRRDRVRQHHVAGHRPLGPEARTILHHRPQPRLGSRRDHVAGVRGGADA